MQFDFNLNLIKPRDGFRKLHCDISTRHRGSITMQAEIISNHQQPE